VNKDYQRGVDILIVTHYLCKQKNLYC